MSLGAKLENMDKKQKVQFLAGVLGQFRESEAYEVISWMLWSKTTAIVERLSDPDLTPDDRHYLGGALSTMGVVTEITEEWLATKYEMEVLEEAQRRLEEHMAKEHVQVEGSYTGLGASI